MTVTLDQFCKATGASHDRGAEWLDAINASAIKYGITNPKRLAAFLAQVGHESAGLERLSENLNYSCDALRKIWPNRFTPAQAAKYGRSATKPANVMMIAILAYANRMGNKGEDGWTYRGRGPIQITGRDNYASVGEAIGIDLLSEPGRLLEPEVGSDAAAYIWKTSGCNALADDGDFVAITRAINGGVVGLDDREKLWQCARNAFCC